MRIRGTDIEIDAGSEGSITYDKWDIKYDDNGRKISETQGSFEENDIITMNIYDESGNVLSIIADIIDGKAVITLLDEDTIPLEPKTYNYDVYSSLIKDFLTRTSNFDIIYTSKSTWGLGS